MGSPIFKLEEQLSELRSNQIAYRLTIENADTNAIRLLDVKPKVPEGATLLEITDRSLAEAQARRSELIEELNLLLKQILWVTSASFRETLVQRQRAAFNDIFTASGVLRFYVQVIFSHPSFQAKMKREFNSIAFNISSGNDATYAQRKWAKPTSEHHAIAELFRAKVVQLAQMESRPDVDESPGLATIEPGSYYTATYVLRFKRGVFEPRKYQIAFEGYFGGPQGPSSVKTASTATNIQISPYPSSLSVVAMCGALLGALLHTSLKSPGTQLLSLTEDLHSGQILVGPIVALIFFNVYEYTSLGKGLTMSISWRSALLIGALCGLAQDKILAALKAIVGVAGAG